MAQLRPNPALKSRSTRPLLSATKYRVWWVAVIFVLFAPYPTVGIALFQGGAIAAQGGAKVEIHVCTFEQNQAQQVSAFSKALLKLFLTTELL